MVVDIIFECADICEHEFDVELLGNVAEIQNFLRITKINLWIN